MQPGKRGLNNSVNVTRNLKKTAPILMTGLHMAHLLGYKWLITGHNLGVYERYSPYVIHKHFLSIIAKLDTILTFVLTRQDTCGTFCLTIVDCVGQMIGVFFTHRKVGLGQSLKTADEHIRQGRPRNPPCLRAKNHVFFLSFPYVSSNQPHYLHCYGF